MGSEPGKPLIEVHASEFLDGPQRERVRARLAIDADDRDRAALSAAARDIATAGVPVGGGGR
jgi:hypothetical protein